MAKPAAIYGQVLPARKANIEARLALHALL
jgi:hypothetical protein